MSEKPIRFLEICNPQCLSLSFHLFFSFSEMSVCLCTSVAFLFPANKIGAGFAPPDDTETAPGDEDFDRARAGVVV